MNNDKNIREYMNNQELNMEKIINEYTNYILKIIRNYNNSFNNEDIEEIASDVFFVVWKNQNKLDINKVLTPYIAGVTKNIILKKQRNNKNITINIEDFENCLYDSKILDFEYENIEKNNIIINELDRMKTEDKNIFTYYYYNSKTMKKIATELNISEKKVKSRLFRIRKKLKNELEKRGYSNGR